MPVTKKKHHAAVTNRGNTVNVITQIPREAFEAFTALCAERSVTRAAMLRLLVIRALDERGK